MRIIHRILPSLLLLLTSFFTTQAWAGETYSEKHYTESIMNNPYGILFYKPNYLLLFNYTNPFIHPTDYDPKATHLDHRDGEVVFQLSIMAPIFHDILGTQNSINLGYTQKSFWQAYVQSAYFRESNYQPELFWKNESFSHFEFSLGVTHESNGRGGAEERSWNRAYADARIFSDNFFISVKPWVLIFKNDSSDIHNPDIVKYLGNGRVLMGFNYKGFVLSLQLRNVIESHFSRGAEELHISFPLTKKIRLHAQAFSGYGQSLIEYKHYTNSVGLGIGLSDWL